MTDRVSELKLFFSTPVWVSRVKNHQEVNKKILEYIKSLESQNPKGVQKSNSKGWHSQDFDMNADNIKDYINSIGPYINETLVDLVKSMNSCFSIVSSRPSARSCLVRSSLKSPLQ